MNIFFSLNFDQSIKLITLICACTAGTFALYQWYHSVKIKRAEFINQIIEKLRFDAELSSIFYEIEYSTHWYDDKFHENISGKEMKIDKLFSYVNYICYLKRYNIICKNEFKCVQYKINRICSMVDTQNYLFNIHHFSQKNIVESAFHELIEYARDEKIIDDNFFNKKCNKYTKHLNF